MIFFYIYSDTFYASKIEDRSSNCLHDIDPPHANRLAHLTTSAL